MILAWFQARVALCALAMLMLLALGHPAHAADPVTWGAVIEPLLPYAGAILSAVCGWAAVRLIAWLGLSSQQAMAQAVTAAAGRAAGLAYQVLAAQAGRVSGAEIRQQAIARGVGYLSATVPDFIGRLGLSPERLQLLVEGELGKLLAADPSVSVAAGVGAGPAAAPAAAGNRAPLRAVAAILPLVLVGGLLSACADGKLTPTGTAAVSAGVTLAGAAAAQNRDVAAVVAGGQLFCQASGTVLALLDASGKPSSVIGKAAPVVAEACKAISAVAVPVAPPPNPGAVPAVVPAAQVL